MQLPRTPSFRLDGKRALVAGASSGIGQACAVALAEYGADVVLAARSVDKLEELAQVLRGGGHAASVLALDVSDVVAAESAVAASGPFDVMVNSAGSALHSPPLRPPRRILTRLRG